MSQILVLSVGSDLSVLDTRDLILRSAGHIVVSATSIEEAVHLFENGDFDLIVLCHTLPLKDCERLARLIRASGSRIPIVCVSGTGLGEHIAFADATLDKDPAAFLANLSDVLSKHVAIQQTGIPDLHHDSESSAANKPPRSSPAIGRQERVTEARPGSLSFLVRNTERLHTQ